MRPQEVIIDRKMLDNMQRVKVWLKPEREFRVTSPVDATEMVARGVGVVVPHNCDTPPEEDKPEPVPVPLAEPKPKRGRPRKVKADAPKPDADAAGE